MNYQLAQLNIGRARGNMDDPVMAGFGARIEEINSLAEDSPGFVWRLKADAGDPTLAALFNDPRVLVNMSVWKDIDSLKHFVYRPVHVELIKDRDEWFTKMASAHQVLWWVPEGHEPSAEEARDRLWHLDRHGPGEHAFTFARPAPKPDIVRLQPDIVV